MLNPIQADFGCQACGQYFTDVNALHYHIKEHKLNQEKYYLKYYPRRDLFTQQPMHFKSRESYFSNDFITRTNLKKWLEAREEINGELVRDYCKGWLVNRKNAKGLVYAPCHIELKTLIAPPMEYYDGLFGSYYELCKEIGFRVKYESPASYKDQLAKEPGDFKIITDSREQRAIPFPDSEVKGLKFGDYARADEGANLVRIERKSMSDFLGTMSAGLERFEREIQRAKDANCQLVVLVEDKFSNFMSFPYLQHIRSKCTVDYISHNIRGLIQKFDNVQFLFCGNRVEAARLIKKILDIPELVKKVDLQLAYERDLL